MNAFTSLPNHILTSIAELGGRELIGALASTNHVLHRLFAPVMNTLFRDELHARVQFLFCHDQGEYSGNDCLWGVMVTPRDNGTEELPQACVCSLQLGRYVHCKYTCEDDYWMEPFCEEKADFKLRSALHEFNWSDLSLVDLNDTSKLHLNPIIFDTIWYQAEKVLTGSAKELIRRFPATPPTILASIDQCLFIIRYADFMDLLNYRGVMSQGVSWKIAQLRFDLCDPCAIEDLFDFTVYLSRDDVLDFGYQLFHIHDPIAIRILLAVFGPGQHFGYSQVLLYG